MSIPGQKCRWLAALATGAAILIGVVYGTWSDAVIIAADLDVAEKNADFVEPVRLTDPVGTIDPGYDKDVAWTEAQLVDSDYDGRYDQVVVTLLNAYPSYSADIGVRIHNGGDLPERIASTDVWADEVLDVGFTDLVGIVLDPGQCVDGTATVHVLQPALQGHMYAFRIDLTVDHWLHGSIGFWKNWDSHDTFAREEIESWLCEIDGSSAWLGPRTVGDMEYLMAAASSNNAHDRFLGHYLAVRLDERSAILSSTQRHDVSAFDPGNYLGLADPSNATLAQVIAAIENKFWMSPTSSQYDTMKDVCVAIYSYDTFPVVTWTPTPEVLR